MRLRLVSLIIILSIIFTIGCYHLDQGYDSETLEYAYPANKNVTINVFKHPEDTITIHESNNTSYVNVNETFFFDKGKSSIAIDKYVKFINYDNNLIINISLVRMTDEEFARHKAYANVDIYLPKGTSYSINYVGYPEIKKT